MFIQVNCILVFLLVAGSQGAPAPKKYGTFFTYNGGVQTNSKLGGRAEAGLKDNLVNGTANARAGGSVSGQAGASVIVLADDKAYETGVNYNGVVGGYGKLSGHGKLGMVDGKNVVATGNTDSQSDGEHNAAGGAIHNTDEDAMVNYNHFYNRRANDVLKGMDDENDYVN